MKKSISREVDLGKEPVGRLLLILALPAILSQLVNALYNIVDRIYIGHIPEVGATALTGVGVCFPVIMIVSAFAALVGMGGAPRASIFMGKKDNVTAEKIMGSCFAALVSVAVILTVFCMIFREPMLYLFGASDATIGYAKDYISIYLWGTIFVQLTLGMNMFISAQGFSTVSMLTVIIGAVTNIVLDPVFIFGLDMGVRGAALATVISQALSAVWAVRFLMGRKTVLRLVKKNIRIDRKILMPCIALGFAPFIMQSTESLLMLAFNSSLLKYGGDIAVGAMTILTSVMQFGMLPLQGLTQGGQPIISYNYGAGRMDRVAKGFRLMLVSCLVFSTVMWSFTEFGTGLVVRVFTGDSSLIETAVPALRIYAAGMLLMGAQMACQQSFIAFGNAKTSAFLALYRKIILLIPLIYIMPHIMEDKVDAVFMAEPVADIVAVVTTCIMFFRYFRKMKNRMEPAAENRAETE